MKTSSENTTAKSASRRSGNGAYAGKSATKRRQERHHRLIAAGIRLIGTQGFAATSIDQICAEAGLTKRYFYEAFGNREDLLIAAYRQISQALLDSMKRAAEAAHEDPRATIRATLNAVFDYLAERPAEGRILMLEILAVRTQLGRVYGNSIGQFVALALAFTRPFLPSAEPEPAELEIIAHGAIGTVTYLAQRWIATGYQQPREQLVAALVRIFDGIGRELGIQMPAS